MAFVSKICGEIHEYIGKLVARFPRLKRICIINDDSAPSALRIALSGAPKNDFIFLKEIFYLNRLRPPEWVYTLSMDTSLKINVLPTKYAPSDERRASLKKIAVQTLRVNAGVSHLLKCKDVVMAKEKKTPKRSKGKAVDIFADESAD